jgi:hypothetical protein
MDYTPKTWLKLYLNEFGADGITYQPTADKKLPCSVCLRTELRSYTVGCFRISQQGEQLTFCHHCIVDMWKVIADKGCDPEGVKCRACRSGDECNG